jgi:cysteine synthase A
LRLARQLGPGHTIVTILCDGGAKYTSRLYNRAWLIERGLIDAIAERPGGPSPAA